MSNNAKRPVYKATPLGQSSPVLQHINYIDFPLKYQKATLLNVTDG